MAASADLTGYEPPGGPANPTHPALPRVGWPARQHGQGHPVGQAVAHHASLESCTAIMPDRQARHRETTPGLKTKINLSSIGVCSFTSPPLGSF